MLELPEVCVAKAAALLKGLCKHLVFANVVVADWSTSEAHGLFEVVAADFRHRIRVIKLLKFKARQRETGGGGNGRGGGGEDLEEWKWQQKLQGLESFSGGNLKHREGWRSRVSMDISKKLRCEDFWQNPKKTRPQLVPTIWSGLSASSRSRWISFSMHSRIASLQACQTANNIYRYMHVKWKLTLVVQRPHKIYEQNTTKFEQPTLRQQANYP